MTCLLKPLVEQAILPLSKLLYGFFMLSLAASEYLSICFFHWMEDNHIVFFIDPIEFNLP